jgi:Mn-dependent DtxR family transcriptional regulator
VNYEKYRGLMLTDEGRAIALKIHRRHETLARFFSLFGLDKETQGKDIEGLEHHLSTSTIECLEDLSRFFEQNPDALKAFLDFRR